MSAPGDEPAFPVQDCAAFQCHGMALRDYFAAKVCPAMFQAIGPAFKANPAATDADFLAHVAAGSYKLADAMLAERLRK